jgi:hypothetical protein
VTASTLDCVAGDPLDLVGQLYAYRSAVAAKDLPMHLHVFAGITRCALIAWWARLADEPQPPSPRTSTPVP